MTDEQVYRGRARSSLKRPLFGDGRTQSDSMRRPTEVGRERRIVRRVQSATLGSGDITERLPEYYHYWDHIELGLRRLEEEACQQTSIADQPAAEKAAETSPREGGSAENEPVVSEVTITFRHEHFGLQTNRSPLR